MIRISRTGFWVVALLMFLNFSGVISAKENQKENASGRSEKGISSSCPAGWSGYLPHPHRCIDYRYCDRGEEFNMQCNRLRVFNPKTNNCDYPYNVPGCDDAH